MTDPTDTRESTPVEPHPASSHRTPREIAKDETGPGGPAAEQAEPVHAGPKKPPSKEDEHIRAAVQRSAHPRQKPGDQHSVSEPVKRPGATRRHQR